MGRQMLPHLERTYAAAQAAKSLARGIGKVAVAPLNLGLSSALETPRLAEALAEVGAGLPGFALRIASADPGTLFDDLLKGDLDMVVATEPRAAHDRIDATPMFTLDYDAVVPAGHALAGGMPVALGALHGVAWIDWTADLAAEFHDGCAEQGVEPDRRHSTASEADALRLVAARLGCTLARRGAALPDDAVMVPVEGLALSRRVVVASVAGRQRPPAGDALLRAIRARAWP